MSLQLLVVGSNTGLGDVALKTAVLISCLQPRSNSGSHVVVYQPGCREPLIRLMFFTVWEMA